MAGIFKRLSERVVAPDSLPRPLPSRARAEVPNDTAAPAGLVEIEVETSVPPRRDATASLSDLREPPHDRPGGRTDSTIAQAPHPVPAPWPRAVNAAATVENSAPPSLSISKVKPPRAPLARAADLPDTELTPAPAAIPVKLSAPLQARPSTGEPARGELDDERPSRQSARPAKLDVPPPRSRDAVRDTPQETAPDVHVTIGRIEVRSDRPQVPANTAPPAARSKRLSLDDYLSRGRR